MSLHRVLFLSVALGVFCASVPVAHADLQDMSGLNGSPNDGEIDPPPPPGGGGGDPILDGCNGSPECPTLVLALLGTLGAGVGLRLRPLLQKRQQTIGA